MKKPPGEALPSAMCVATLTNKATPDRNEDAVILIRPAAEHFGGVAVADGLGSAAYARAAARLAVEATQVELEGGQPPQELDDLFARVHRRFVQHVDQHVESHQKDCVGAMSGWLTTLIVALETEQEIQIGYLGNGGIWHLRADFQQFPPNVALPWTSVNLLNPHSILHGGKEALSRVMCGNRLAPVVPTVLRLKKDHLVGDLVLLCSDGIYSPDQTVQGTDATGKFWLGVEESLLRFYRTLRRLFETGSAPADPQFLQAGMDAYLLELKEEGLLEDDASLGLIVTGAAQRYLRQGQSGNPP